MRYLQSVRSRWLNIGQVPFWRIFSLHERRFMRKRSRGAFRARASRAIFAFSLAHIAPTV